MSGKEKKKDSTLSVVACMLTGVALIIPMPLLLSFPLALAGVIIGLIDLAQKKEEFRHLGSLFAVILGIIYVIVAAIQFM